ncbi:unnamed protein product [Strongylus vulgaris]|uniref:Uncharacterized protein n=1 Tax=Strongylus vulgaris TaxID=40348 RepID=A0A3P7JHG7_STRVU|nr:unnamed protein product [Strongylus vulgaris]
MRRNINNQAIGSLPACLEQGRFRGARCKRRIVQVKENVSSYIRLLITLAKFQRYVWIDAAARRQRNRAKYGKNRLELHWPSSSAMCGSMQQLGGSIIEPNMGRIDKTKPPVDNLDNIPNYPAGLMRYLGISPEPLKTPLPKEFVQEEESQPKRDQVSKESGNFLTNTTTNPEPSKTLLPKEIVQEEESQPRREQVSKEAGNLLTNTATNNDNVTKKEETSLKRKKNADRNKKVIKKEPRQDIEQSRKPVKNSSSEILLVTSTFIKN